MWGLEASRTAVDLARQNLADVADRVTLTAGRVERGLVGCRAGPTSWCWIRRGRGPVAAVIEQVAARRPRAVAYVACDPAALARDLATAQALGYAPQRSPRTTCSR